jgi:uncharacterized membrane protein
MAGIGWKLQRLIDRGSLTGAIGAYLTGVVVTSAPWLLTTLVLMGLRLAARSHETQDFLIVERMVTIIYAVTVVLSAPIQVVVSRYTADRLYDRRLEAIAAPLRRSLTLTLAGFALVGAAIVLLMRVPIAVALAGTVLTVTVGVQWVMLAVGGGLTSPAVVLRAFGLGAPASVLGALWLERSFGLGAVGFLCGFVLGQLLTLALLLHGVARALPDASDESARLAPAFAEYKLLALSSLAYHLAIWADKIVVWLLAGRETATLYTSAAALAWFSVIPAFAWLYVQIETRFYQHFKGFYGAVEGGGTLAHLQERAALVRSEALRILRGAALVQGAVTAVGLMSATAVIHTTRLPPETVLLFRLTLVGAALQVTALLALLLLYYFDLRRDALRVSLTLLFAEVVLTVLCWKLGLPPGVGYVLACAAACALGIRLVRRRLGTLLVDTFQLQPYGSM